MELTENEKRLLNTMVDRALAFRERAKNKWAKLMVDSFLETISHGDGFEMLNVEFSPGGALKNVNMYQGTWEGYCAKCDEDGDVIGFGTFREEPLGLYYDAFFKLVDHITNTSAPKLSTEEVRELFDTMDRLSPQRLNDEDAERLEKAGFLTHQ